VGYISDQRLVAIKDGKHLGEAGTGIFEIHPEKSSGERGKNNLMVYSAGEVANF
jgi:hypothetical protein